MLMLDDSVGSELESYMLADECLLGEIFTLYKSDITYAKELASRTKASNRRVACNNPRWD